MGYEIKVKYHPKKEEGIGYDTEKLEEQIKKVGKPFDDSGLEQLAGAVMAQLARRDVMVVDLEIDELVRRPVKFKGAADGKGIVLKNKKFSLDQTAKLVANDFVEEEVLEIDPESIPEGMQPHEVLAMKRQSENLDNLYANPDANLPVHRKSPSPTTVDQRKVIYHVLFQPELHMANEAKSMKFTVDKKYPVHAQREHPSGGMFGSYLSITNDRGKVVEVDEKFFVPAGKGLYGDAQLGFSDSTKDNGPKLSYENELTIGPHPAERRPAMDISQIPEEYRNIPLDDGTITVDMGVPDIRGR